MRPWQWTKNGVVLAAMVFALADSKQNITLEYALPRMLVAVIVFCLLSSGVYLFNDVIDRKSDQLHPLKKNRPLASGELSVPLAVFVAVFLVMGSVTGAYVFDHMLGYIAGLYLVVQFAYSVFLKRIALVDVIIIAIGFVIRAIAGAAVLHADLSPWLVLCTFLLAMFLALCKRRAEKEELNEEAHNTRLSMRDYDVKLLDQLIAIVSSSTIVCYSIYTLSDNTYAKFGTYALGFTIPFVMFGVFRYLDITYRLHGAQRPDRVLLKDIAIKIDILLYGLTVLFIFMFCVNS